MKVDHDENVTTEIDVMVDRLVESLEASRKGARVRILRALGLSGSLPLPEERPSEE